VVGAPQQLRLECSDDLEVLEVYSPAVHETRVVERLPEAATAAR
jgi:hypothetical protein